MKPQLLLPAALFAAFVTTAQGQDLLQDHVESHALRYAAMVERAYARLDGHIRRRSTAAVSWTDEATPPASSGWLDVWTNVGLRARYCDDVLLVYIGASALKGTGENHRLIQQARATLLPARETGVRLPSLGWLDGLEVTVDGDVRVLPACMATQYTDELPSGRAALAGDVVDPWTDLRQRVTYERRELVCPDGQHGTRRERRTVTTPYTANGQPAGDPVFGQWEALAGSWCRSDYVVYDVYTQQCSWYQGEPFHATLTGTDTYRIPITVSADGRTWGDPEFVSSTCWGAPPGAVPVPTSSAVEVIESQTLTCPPNHDGSIEQRRTRTTATTTYPWGSPQLVSVEYTTWRTASNTCTEIVEEEGNGGDRGENEMADGISTDGDGLPGDADAGNDGGTGGNFGGGDGGDFGGPGDK